MLQQDRRLSFQGVQTPGTHCTALVSLTVVVGNAAQSQVLLDGGITAVPLPALRAAEVASFSLAPHVVQAGLAKVVAAREQVGVAVDFQTHWAGEVLMQDSGLLRLAEVHPVFTQRAFRRAEKRNGRET